MAIKFPLKLLKPVQDFLKREEKKLEKRKQDLQKEDPFSDKDRVLDNAPDTDAAEQEGHSRASALGQEIDRKLIQIRKALSRLNLGKYGICEECGEMIDTDRLMIRPEATTCIECERKIEEKKE